MSDYKPGESLESFVTRQLAEKMLEEVKKDPEWDSLLTGKGVAQPLGILSNLAATPPKLLRPCKQCAGQGFVLIKNGEDAMDCPRCNGTGKER